jgi:hypothetical protein
MILYVNGCSWSSLSNEDMTDKVYGDYIAEKMNWELINHSVPGASNSRIFRSSLRNVQKLLKNNSPSDILCILNVTNACRGDVWLDFDDIKNVETFVESTNNPLILKSINKYKESSDGDYTSWNGADPMISDILGWFSGYHRYALKMEMSDEKYLYDAFYNILSFTSFLKERNVKYLIFFANTPDNVPELISGVEWLSDLYDEIKKDPSILSITSDEVFTEWAIKNNVGMFDKPFSDSMSVALHPNTLGHKLWADVLLNKLKELYAI